MMIPTRNGSREIEVQTLKRRTPPPLKGLPVKGQKELPLDMFDLGERISRISSMARELEIRVNAEQFSIDKDELIRSIGRLEADLRRRGVR